MSKNYYWGQENPSDQARVIIGGLRGHIHNASKGLNLNPENCNLLLDMLETLVSEHMPKTWEKKNEG